MVSAMLSPFVAELESAVAKPNTLPRARAGFVEQCGKFFAGADSGIPAAIGGNVRRRGKQPVDLFHTEIERIDQMSHVSESPYRCSFVLLL